VHQILRRAIASGTVLLLLAAPLSACGGADDAPPAAASTATASGRAMTKVLVLDFEAAAATLHAGDRIPSALPNGPRGEVAMAGQGERPLRLVSGPDHQGHAVAFPAPCPAERAKTCPKAIIEIYPDASVSPGTADFEWGASVRIDRRETAQGSNIVQKGFSLGGGSQWKVQMDGAKGHPSCVLVGQHDTQIHEVYAEVTIANGKWHDVSCRRAGDELVITVDGSPQKSVLIPRDMTIAPPGPVRIGGKDLKPDNDQYFGSLDNVYVAVPR
jgi:hypothetical protein